MRATAKKPAPPKLALKPRRRRGANAESKLVTAILGALHLAFRDKVWFIRINAGAIKTGTRFIHLAPKGTADILGCVQPTGRLVALEVKLPGEEPTAEQVQWANERRAQGAYTACVHSIQEALDAVGNAIQLEEAYMRMGFLSRGKA